MLNILYIYNLNSFAKLILNEKINLKKNLVIAIFQIVFGCISNSYHYFNKSDIYSIISLFLTYGLLIMSALTFKNKRKVVYICFLYLMIDSILQSVVSMLVAMAAEDNIILIYVRAAAVILNLILVFGLSLLIREKSEEVRVNLSTIPRSIYVIILISLILLGLICGYLDVKLTVDSLPTEILSVLIILIVPILIVLMIKLIFYSLSSCYYENISSVMEHQLHTQLRYNDYMSKMAKQIRAFRHDYNNHLICLQSFINAGELNKAADYLKSITKKEVLESTRFSSGNYIANAILNEKNDFAAQNGIDIHFNGVISDTLPSTELCAILFNSLDNAIEACNLLSHDSDKIIQVKCAVMNNIQVITVSNPNFKKTDLTTSKLDKSNHGIGIDNIRKCVSKLNGNMQISQTVPEFVMEITIPLQSMTM